MDDLVRERRQAVIDTLEFLVGQPWISKKARKVIADMAADVEHGIPGEWWSCPICEETACDSCCPLMPLRRGVDYRD